MLWLGWVHKLRGKETIVSKAQHDLKKCATALRVFEDVICLSLRQFNHAIAKSGHNTTKITIWGDVEEMMESTIHHTKKGIADNPPYIKMVID